MRVRRVEVTYGEKKKVGRLVVSYGRTIDDRIPRNILPISQEDAAVLIAEKPVLETFDDIYRLAKRNK